MTYLHQKIDPASGSSVGTVLTSDSVSIPRMHLPVVTRFGDRVDVRNKDTVRISRFANGESRVQNAPAVVRVWHDEKCRELTSHEARAFAAQLLAAAALAESQNS